MSLFIKCITCDQVVLLPFSLKGNCRLLGSPPTPKKEKHLIKVSKHKIMQTYMYFQRKEPDIYLHSQDKTWMTHQISCIFSI